MEENSEIKKSYNDRLQNILNNLSKCKKTFMSEGEECKNLREINTKLMTELKDARELEKSYRYQLITSREMIANLQETVSQLVYLKRDVKKLKDELVSKDSVIDTFEKEKENVTRKHNEALIELRAAQKKDIEDLMQDNNRRVQQVQIELDTQVAQMTCVAEELKSRIKEMENEHKEQMNAVVLECEEKMQRQASLGAQLQEKATREAAAAQAHLHAYRTKLETLEEKLKQSQFKEYVGQSTYPSQYESKVERPYSVERDPYANAPNPLKAPEQSKAFKQGTLQVMYSEGKSKTNEKKGPFNITKKRKLYNEKDFLNHN